MECSIGFSSHKGWLASLIKWATKSEASHSFVILYYKYNQIVIHAQGLKVYAMHIDEFNKINNTVKTYPIELTQDKIDWLWSKTGISYGVLSLIGFIWVIIGKKLGHTWKNPLADTTNSYFCSELVAELLDLPNPEEYTPQDLINYLDRR